jgi:hypothetical protein
MSGLVTAGTGCCEDPENEIMQAAGTALPNLTPADPAENHVTYAVVAGVAQPTGFWSAADGAWYPVTSPENEVLTGPGAPAGTPPDATERKFWVNTTTNQITHYWNGAAWVPLTAADNEIISGTVAPVATPADPTERKLFVNSTSNQITHWWDPATNTWKPIVGTFPIILRCDGTTAVAADRFLTANAGSGAASNSLGGVLPASRQLWSFANDGTGCPTEVVAPAAPCTDATIPTASVFLGGLADGTVGWVRPSKSDRPNVRIGTGTLTAVLATDNIIQVTGNGSVALPAINAADLCESRRITVKRISNNPLETVRVTAAGGLDGAPGASISLIAASTFGTLTGEAATFYHDGTVWRIESRY